LESEDQLIERIAKAVPPVRGAARRGELRLGIGDDAAVLAPGRHDDWVLSCDAFLQDVHFSVGAEPPGSVGYKALARAASDLAAMGAKPAYFLLTLGLPAKLTGKWLDQFLGGMRRASRELGMRLAGGDTSRTGAVSISITVVGRVGRGLAVTRSGARPGDTVFVSGRLGRAQLGLQLMNARGRGKSAAGRLARLLDPHLYPKIRIELGAWLAKHRVASAMMDISDGLSTDLARMCRASRVAARLWAGRIPCVAIPESARRALHGRLDPLHMALHGGEDYELLFTVPKRNLRRLRAAPGFSQIAAIGEIERGSHITLLGADGRARRLEAGGWDPFRQR
jgi:thiamine-monophosphate kinase